MNKNKNELNIVSIKTIVPMFLSADDLYPCLPGGFSKDIDANICGQVSR